MLQGFKRKLGIALLILIGIPLLVIAAINEDEGMFSPFHPMSWPAQAIEVISNLGNSQHFTTSESMLLDPKIERVVAKEIKDEWEVTWVEVRQDFLTSEYRINITNLKVDPRNFRLALYFNGSGSNINELEVISFDELKATTRKVPTYGTCYDSFKKPNQTSYSCINGTKDEQYITWVPVGDENTIRTTKDYKHSFRSINNNPGSTRQFRLIFKHEPAWKEKEGTFALIDTLTDEIFHPTWYAGWDRRINLTYTDLTGVSQQEVFITANITGLILQTNNCYELRVANADNEVLYEYRVNESGASQSQGSQWCHINIIANITRVSETDNTTIFPVYFDNIGASDPGYNLDIGNYDDFEDTRDSLGYAGASVPNNSVYRSKKWSGAGCSGTTCNVTNGAYRFAGENDGSSVLNTRWIANNSMVNSSIGRLNFSLTHLDGSSRNYLAVLLRNTTHIDQPCASEVFEWGWQTTQKDNSNITTGVNHTIGWNITANPSLAGNYTVEIILDDNKTSSKQMICRSPEGLQVEFKFEVRGVVGDPGLINGAWHSFDWYNIPQGTVSLGGEEMNQTLNVSLPNIQLSDNYTRSLPINFNLQYNVTGSLLEDCYYNNTDNQDYTLFTCSDLTNLTFNSSGLKQYQWCANNTYGEEACNSDFFTLYHVLENVSEIRDELGEGEQNVIILNVTIEPDHNFDVAANLVWNNTNYSHGDKQDFDISNFSFTNTFVVPNIGVQTGSVIDYYWNYTINNSIRFVTTTDNQTVYSVDIDNCTDYDNPILNYTIYDEETKLNDDLTNTSIETDITLQSLSNITQTWEYAVSTINHTFLTICVSDSFLNFTNYSLGAVTKYSADDYVVEYHYIDNYTLYDNNTQTINLYDLETTEATSFLMTFNDEVYLPVEDAIIDVWRYYVGDGEYLSVEHGKTNDQGETRLHLVTEDIKYVFYVRKEGELLYTSPEYLALCQATPCVINLQQTQADPIHEDFQQIDNLDYSVTLDEDTRTITLTFSTQDGSSAEMEMNVTILDAYVNNTACQDSATSSGGTLACTVPNVYANTTYYVKVYKDDDLVTYRLFSLSPDAFETFGYTGVVLAALMFMMLTLMAVPSSGAAVLIFGAIGLVFATMLTIFSGGSIFGVGSSILWLIIAIVIMIYKMSNKRAT